jgi:hypothetical protein
VRKSLIDPQSTLSFGTFWLKATAGADRTARGSRIVFGEVSMRQLESNGTQMRTPPEDPGKDPGSASEWDTETDVMPPETSRQLRRISRQLQQGE